jgi:hypothetical protein
LLAEIIGVLVRGQSMALLNNKIFFVKEDFIMSNKLIYLVCLVFVLGVAGNAWADSLIKIDPATIETGHVYLFNNVVDSNLPDDSANSLIGNILGDPNVVDGLNGQALLLDGVDDGVHLPDDSLINTSTHQNHTVIAVFNCADVSKSEYQCVYEEGGSTRVLTIYVHEGPPRRRPRPGRGQV